MPKGEVRVCFTMPCNQSFADEPTQGDVRVESACACGFAGEKNIKQRFDFASNRLALAIVLVAVAFSVWLVAIQAYLQVHERGVVIAVTEARTKNLTRILEEHARQSLSRIEARLGVARDALEAAPATPAKSRQVLASFQLGESYIKALTLVDRDGRVMATTAAGDWGTRQVGGSDYFESQRERGAGGASFGAPLVHGGKRIWPASLGLRGAGGEFAGAVVLDIDPEYFQAFYDSIDTGVNGGVALFMRNGWIAVRSPNDPAVLARAWNNTPMFREHLPRAETGTVRQVVVADGIERIYTYRALRDFPVIVYLGLSLSDSLAEWRNEAWRLGAVTLLVLLGNAMLTTLLVQQMRRRENAETVLRLSEQRFRGLTALSSDWYWEQDEQHRFTYLSPGYSHATVTEGRMPPMGRRLWDLNLEGMIGAQVEAFRAGLEARQAFHEIELARTTDDGEKLYFQISGEPVFDQMGEFRGYRGVGHNVTEARRAEQHIAALNASLESRVHERTEQLEGAIDEIEAFCYTLAHDLRAPARAIAGFGGMLVEEQAAVLPPEALTDLRRMVDSAMAMGTRLDSLLDFARLLRKPLVPAPVDMNALAAEVAATLCAAEESGRVELTIAALPGCLGDTALLRQVWSGLLSNAFKFSRFSRPASIQVGAIPDGDRPGFCVYYVRDNGVGFDMVYASKLFGVFQRLQTDARFEGAGVGLAFVKRILQLHGGRIWCEGETARGAVFFFSLPKAAP